ncbi:hypothetical protein [Helicobacter anatolicus]|uniref:hypothetical protein n=1 Tax=Helicobacter anatolicus TaxID=2905874 RepID=UPI001E3929C2|nr:hypothetical protein [Helicobacter anatolicus]MCE3037692.1 hypothetical protein [Helicobacter anatolicus]MCE3040021.1 hypothetical protein [Helicobacter anatolicus]
MSKKINGKNLHIVLDENSKKILEEMAKQQNKSYTAIIQELIKFNNETKNSYVFVKMVELISFNKKKYKDLNATFNNINQIAYHINSFKKSRHFQEEIFNTSFFTHINQEIKNCRDLLEDIRILVLKNLILLENNFGKKQKGVEFSRVYNKFLKRLILKEGYKRGLFSKVFEKLDSQTLKKLAEEDRF